MTSMAMTASFLPIAAANHSSATAQKALIAKASTATATATTTSNTNLKIKNVKVDSRQGRRELVAAAVTVAVANFAKVAIADEPKHGTSEAKQKYAVVCVTNPTARICRN